MSPWVLDEFMQSLFAQESGSGSDSSISCSSCFSAITILEDNAKTHNDSSATLSISQLQTLVHLTSRLNLFPESFLSLQVMLSKYFRGARNVDVNDTPVRQTRRNSFPLRAMDKTGTTATPRHRGGKVVLQPPHSNNNKQQLVLEPSSITYSPPASPKGQNEKRQRSHSMTSSISRWNSEQQQLTNNTVSSSSSTTTPPSVNKKPMSLYSLLDLAINMTASIDDDDDDDNDDGTDEPTSKQKHLSSSSSFPCSLFQPVSVVLPKGSNHSTRSSSRRSSNSRREMNQDTMMSPFQPALLLPRDDSTSSNNKSKMDKEDSNSRSCSSAIEKDSLSSFARYTFQQQTIAAYAASRKTHIPDSASSAAAAAAANMNKNSLSSFAMYSSDKSGSAHSFASGMSCSFAESCDDSSSSSFALSDGDSDDYDDDDDDDDSSSCCSSGDDGSTETITGSSSNSSNSSVIRSESVGDNKERSIANNDKNAALAVVGESFKCAADSSCSNSNPVFPAAYSLRLLSTFVVQQATGGASLQ
jgi:hypothetical protein